LVLQDNPIKETKRNYNMLIFHLKETKHKRFIVKTYMLLFRHLWFRMSNWFAFPHIFGNFTPGWLAQQFESWFQFFQSLPRNWRIL